MQEGFLPTGHVIGVEFGAIDVKQSSLPANLYLNLTFVSAFLFDIIIVLMRGYDEIIWIISFVYCYPTHLIILI